MEWRARRATSCGRRRIACIARVRSCAVCKFIQNSGEFLKYPAKRMAVSGVMPRFPRTNSLTRLMGMPSLLASSAWLRPNGSRNSCKRISPGCVAIRWLGNIGCVYRILITVGKVQLKEILVVGRFGSPVGLVRERSFAAPETGSAQDDTQLRMR